MLLILPPALIQVQPAALPVEVEAKPGVFIIQGAPTPATFARLKAQGITQVFNLRTPAEGDFTFEVEGAKAAGAAYHACPIAHPIQAEAVDAFRAGMRSLPKGARVLVHCATGNRAAAALMAYWTLDQGMPLPEAKALAEKSGLTNAGLEEAMLAYIQGRQAKS